MGGQEQASCRVKGLFCIFEKILMTLLAVGNSSTVAKENLGQLGRKHK